MLSPDSLKRIDQEVAKYPSDRMQSAVMGSLRIAQEENGWLSMETMDFIAKRLGMRTIQVYEVATFYSMYDLKPVGKYKICVCTNVACMLRDSQDIVGHLEKRLGIKPGGMTADGKFSLVEVECLAACGGAPMLQIGDEYYENLTPARIDQILDELD